MNPDHNSTRGQEKDTKRRLHGSAAAAAASVVGAVAATVNNDANDNSEISFEIHLVFGSDDDKS